MNNYEKIIEFIPNGDYNEDTIYEYDGHKVPRVTEVLGFFDNEGLISWANKIGLKNQSYSEVVGKASNLGTKTHAMIEHFLKTGEEPAMPSPSYRSFKMWWEDITEDNNIIILESEKKLVCKWFGGTLDFLFKLNDKTYLVDFKTSNTITYKYWMQLAAYRYMLIQEAHIGVDGCIILQLNKKIPSYREYALQLENRNSYNFMEQCTAAFFNILAGYYSINHVRNMYKDVEFL